MKGFTLIEVLVSFSVIALLSAFSIASFSSYTTSQTFQNAVLNVSSTLALAKSRAISRVKPAACAGQVLNGYFVSFTSSTQYVFGVLCNTTSYTLQTQQLPQNISFQSGTATRIVFSTATAVVANPGQILITGSGMTKKIIVDATGKISVQ